MLSYDELSLLMTLVREEEKRTVKEMHVGRVQMINKLHGIWQELYAMREAYTDQVKRIKTAQRGN